MKKVFTSLFLIFNFFFLIKGIAQQDPQFSQNMFIKLPVNPGYAGTNGAICATAVYRTQWVGFPGAPKTLYFSLDAPVPALHGGAGLTVVSDKLGNFNFMHARGAYSYHRVIGTGLLGIGLEVGMLQSSVQNNWLAPDGTNGNTDNSIPSTAVKKTTYDVGLGVYFRTGPLYAGISASHLPQQQLKATNFDYKAARHYYVMAGYDFILSSPFTLRPSVHIKSDAAVTTFDVNVNLLYNNKVWAGVSYRLQDAIVPMLGFALPVTGKSTLKIGYAYDLGASDLKTYHNNTHEILLNYCIKFTPKPKTQSHENPRNMGMSRSKLVF
ncbi:MAG: type IX secretion system membrane protein PorP/SprF [Bacteroidetes bacterium]|nr:type IX secretion system membrane protein PorP/SprF [Bacteroidota bacterium]